MPSNVETKSPNFYALYQRAVVDEVMANEQYLTAENATAQSMHSVAARLKAASTYDALIRQASLLIAANDKSDSLKFTFEEVLLRLSAIHAHGLRDGVLEADVESWNRTFNVLIPDHTRGFIIEQSNYLENLLKTDRSHSNGHDTRTARVSDHSSDVINNHHSKRYTEQKNLNSKSNEFSAPKFVEHDGKAKSLNISAKTPPIASSYNTSPLGSEIKNGGFCNQENSSESDPNVGNQKSNSPFVTAGQLMGRPAPKKPNNLLQGPCRSVGLSKRARHAQEEPSSARNENEKILQGADEEEDPRLRAIDPKLLETIRNDIIGKVDQVGWDHIAGLDHAKRTIKEIVIWPMLRPDIFTGLRGPPKGLLLFGPPGTGKTMIGKCIASQAAATFFSISASSLTSKWVGEGEKLVRALFTCARVMQPSVVFIDEIDSLLSQRTDGEFEASRRIKTEFLVQFDGASTSADDRILIIGATNRPQELDEAARRRLVKRLYVSLPDGEARVAIVRRLLACQKSFLSEENLLEVMNRTDGYSGADMDNLCREAALGPIRSLGVDILNVSADEVRCITVNDIWDAMRQVRASVSPADLELYCRWNEQYGSLSV